MIRRRLWFTLQWGAEMILAQKTQEGRAHPASKSQLIQKYLMLPSFAVADCLWSCQAARVCRARWKGKVQPAEWRPRNYQWCLLEGFLRGNEDRAQSWPEQLLDIFSPLCLFFFLDILWLLSPSSSKILVLEPIRYGESRTICEANQATDTLPF